MHPLIQTPVISHDNMSSFFFKKDKDGLMLHFATETIDSENNLFHNWHCMPLKQDFIDQLKTHGRLPEPSVKAYFDEIAKNDELKKENERLKATMQKIPSSDLEEEAEQEEI